MLSIVIPAYNVEQYIEECLNSIIYQIELSEFSHEIIIINDGSTDSTLDTLNAFSMRYNYIKIVSQENKGQSAARNLGLKLINNEYIWLIDADDMIASGAIEYIEKKLGQLDVDILCFSGAVLEDSVNQFSSESLSYKRTNSEGVESPAEFVKNIKQSQLTYFVQPCHYIFKSVLSKKVNFLEGVIYEDNLFTTNLFFSRKNKIFSTNKELYIRRLRDNSTMTSQMTEHNVESFYNVMQELLNNRGLYNNHVCSKFTDEFITSILNSYLISLHRVHTFSFLKRIKSVFKCLEISKNIMNKNTLILLFIPTIVYKFFKKIKG